MASTLTMYQPATTLPARISFRASAVGHLNQADSRSSLEILMFSTRTSSAPYTPTLVGLSRSSSFPTEMSYSVTLNSAILVGAVTSTVGRSRGCVSHAASASAMSFSLSPGTSRMMSSVIAFCFSLVQCRLRLHPPPPSEAMIFGWHYPQPRLPFCAVFLDYIASPVGVLIEPSLAKARSHQISSRERRDARLPPPPHHPS